MNQAKEGEFGSVQIDIPIIITNSKNKEYSNTPTVAVKSIPKKTLIDMPKLPQNKNKSFKNIPKKKHIANEKLSPRKQ